MAFEIRFTRHTFFVLDGLGLHVSIAGREFAWTRGFGFTFG